MSHAEPSCVLFVNPDLLQLRDLYTRTGAEILLVSVRSDVENFTTKPRIFTSSPRVADFFLASTNRTVNDFAVKLQAYCVADIQARACIICNSRSYYSDVRL